MELHTQLISRAQAKALGMKHYFTGKPCKRGGVWYRRASDKRCQCGACLDQKRRYHEENREVVQEWKRRWREENSEAMLERQRRWRKENRDAERERRRRHYEENRDAERERRRRHYEENRDAERECQRRWREENREAMLERKRRYREENPHIALSAYARRRAAKRQRILLGDCELTHFIEREAYDLARDRAELTGVDWHVDHMLPMQGDTVSGFHHWSNLQVIPASLNLVKGNRSVMTEPFAWLAHLDDTGPLIEAAA